MLLHPDCREALQITTRKSICGDMTAKAGIPFLRVYPIPVLSGNDGERGFSSPGVNSMPFMEHW